MKKCKIIVVAYLKVLFWDFLEGTEEKQEKTPVTFEPRKPEL
jgi:hypothetical protein